MEPKSPPNYEACLAESKANMQIEGFDPQVSKETVENHVPSITRKSLREKTLAHTAQKKPINQ